MNAPPLPLPPRAPYVPPVLEPLGSWSALTLQQTININLDLLPLPEPADL